jgi:hypothetical protein
MDQILKDYREELAKLKTVEQCQDECTLVATTTESSSPQRENTYLLRQEILRARIDETVKENRALRRSLGKQEEKLSALKQESTRAHRNYRAEVDKLVQQKHLREADFEALTKIHAALIEKHDALTQHHAVLKTQHACLQQQYQDKCCEQEQAELAQQIHQQTVKDHLTVPQAAEIRAVACNNSADDRDDSADASLQHGDGMGLQQKGLATLQGSSEVVKAAIVERELKVRCELS